MDDSDFFWENAEHLTYLELFVLSAIKQLTPVAFAPSILATIKQPSGRATSAGTLYAILARLESRGLAICEPRVPGRRWTQAAQAHSPNP